MTRRNTLVCVLAAALLIPVLLRAEHTREWRQTEYTEFDKGTAAKFVLDPHGLLPKAA